MITEDEATRLLKRADPACVDDSVPFVDAAGYLDALRTRSTTVTLINTEPTPTRQSTRHRWLIAAAAAVVAIVVGGLALATRDDDPNEQIPAATTVAPDAATAAEDVARSFLDAYVANDADRALAYLADDVIASQSGSFAESGATVVSAEEFRREIAWNEAARVKWNLHDCEPHDDGTAAGITVRCAFDFHEFGSDAIGLGPYGEVFWDLTVRDGAIVAANRELATNQSSNEMWVPFTGWIRTVHPDDVLVMYRDSSQTWRQTTDEALQLWEQRTREYVQAVLTRREAYPAEVGAICATQAARLGELAVPAEDALDQIAAWNAAAAAIMEQAHGELIVLDMPPVATENTMAYTSFYNKLIRLVRIAEGSAEAATAGDTTRLAELGAVHLQVRQAMMSGPAGSGLEKCLESLPS